MYSFIGKYLVNKILTQILIKRFLATTSINQTGLLLLGLSTSNFNGLYATINYLCVYTFTILIFFCIILNLTYNNINLQNLSWLNFTNNKNGWYSIILTIIFLNLAGFPPLLGFFVKFYLLLEIGLSGCWEIVLITIFCNLISFYYYLQVIFTIFFEPNFKWIKFQIKPYLNIIKWFLHNMFLPIFLFILFHYKFPFMYL